MTIEAMLLRPSTQGPASATERLRLAVRRVLPPVVALAAVYVGWALVVRFGNPSPVVLPAPGDVLGQLGLLFQDSAFRHDVLVTVRRVVLGFLIGSALGVLVGSAVGSVAFVRHAIDPLLRFLRYIIPFAWVPIAAVIFGLSESGKLFVTGYASFFIVTFQVIQGMSGTDQDLVKAGRMLGTSGVSEVGRVKLPYAIPAIATGLRLGLGYSWLSVLVAETVNASTGLGVRLTQSTQFSQTTTVFALVIVIGVIGFVFNAVISKLERMISWSA